MSLPVSTISKPAINLNYNSMTIKNDNIQDKDIKTLQGQIVGWKVFCWAMGIILVLFGTCFATISSVSLKVDNVQVQYTEIRAQLSQIQTDLLWLKNQAEHN
jgi:hypothetical protein